VNQEVVECGGKDDWPEKLPVKLVLGTIVFEDS
jgi:hypothetical protein